MMMKQAMRTLAGMTLRRRETRMLAADQNEGGGQPHADAELHLGGYAQDGAEPEDQPERRNLFP